MKRLMMLLILSMPAYAITFQANNFVNGNIAPEQYSLVTVERDRRIGTIMDEKMTCINANRNYYCEMDEKMLGSCFANVCLWPTKTFKPWYSWRYSKTPCAGLAVLAGKEYAPLMEWAGCTKNESYWCCSPYAFPSLETQFAQKEKKPKPTIATGALLVLDAGKWKAFELGRFRKNKYKPEERALEFEKARCAQGGGKVSIIDPKYGSFFLDKNNIKPGMRAFYLTADSVTPLVTWC